MTKLEKQASSAGKKLAIALFAVEDYQGSPDDVLEEAKFWARQMVNAPHKGVEDALDSLVQYYDGGKDGYSN